MGAFGGGGIHHHEHVGRAFRRDLAGVLIVRPVALPGEHAGEQNHFQIGVGGVFIGPNMTRRTATFGTCRGFRDLRDLDRTATDRRRTIGRATAAARDAIRVSRANQHRQPDRLRALSRQTEQDRQSAGQENHENRSRTKKSRNVTRCYLGSTRKSTNCKSLFDQIQTPDGKMNRRRFPTPANWPLETEWPGFIK